MGGIKIRIFRGKSLSDKVLTRTKYVETNSVKKLTSKQAGRILANNFPQFDDLLNRHGLQKANEGFLAMRPFEPTEKCGNHYMWEYALVSEEAD